MSISKPQQQNFKNVNVNLGRDREGEEGHRITLEITVIKKGIKATNLPFYQFTKRASLKDTGNKTGSV